MAPSVPCTSKAVPTTKYHLGFILSSPDLILLDIDLPLENGIDFCRKLHTKSPIPTIMLTASDDDIDRVLSYEVGADHYITKPFNPKVLIAAIKAVLRRSLELQNDKLEQKFSQYAYFKDWCFNIKERSLTHTTNGISTELTTKEFEVLQLLIEYHGEPLSRDSLIIKLYWRQPGVPFSTPYVCQVLLLLLL